MPVADRTGLPGIAVAEPRKNPERAGVLGKHGAGASEQVDAIDARKADAREGAPLRADDRKFGAAAQSSRGTPGADDNVTENGIGRGQDLIGRQPDLVPETFQSLPTPLVIKIADALREDEFPAVR